MSYDSIEAMKAANEAAGFTWFGAAEMQAFGTRVLPEIYGGRFFITYDTDGGSVKGFTIRECEDDGDVHTARDSAGLCGYPTANTAKSAARKLADQTRGKA
jgi:hypothetical protein